ncbi:hypothetical protein QQX98_005648 [Neonectria punicea]|uniref:SRR1-like domain-containing protein n=1 Tax=Neonectria punicea TaxID=979145 RepID=A0ABR1H3N3_9HYPO
MAPASDTSSDYAFPTARERLAKIQTRVVGGRNLKLANYVRDIYDSGAKMFTKDMFRQLEADLAKDPRPDKISICTMNGMVRSVSLGSFPPGNGSDAANDHVAHFGFKIYQCMVDEAEDGADDYRPDANMEKKPITDEDRMYATQTVFLGWSSDDLTSPVDLAQLQAAWDEARALWLESDSYAKLTELVTESKPKANKVVCFGLGSLEGSVDYSTLDLKHSLDGLPRRSAITQHLAAITMATLLGQQRGIDRVPILVQDPAYTTLGQQFLAAQDIEVIGGNGALGFTYVDEDTLVVSCHPNVPVKQIVADIARPAAMLWNEVRLEETVAEWSIHTTYDGQETLCLPWVTDEDSPRTRELVKGYDMHKFCLDPERFGDLGFYVRKDEGSA